MRIYDITVVRNVNFDLVLGRRVELLSSLYYIFERIR